MNKIEYIMNKIEYTDAEIEECRKESLAEYGLVEITKPKTMGYHEALHTSFIAMDSVERYLMEHPAILGDPEAYKMAHNAFSNLFNLYQYLGERHL